jgi:uncharacterized protein (TIGR03086 family)
LWAQYGVMDTTTTRTTPARTNPARFHLAIDPRPLFSAATTTGTEVIGALRPDQLANATPCPEFDVRTLLGHLVDVLHRVAAMGRGDDQAPAPTEVAVVTDDAWRATWRAAADDAIAAWADDAALERTIVLPWATDKGGVALLGYVSEVTVHTWDLAQAAGQRPKWNDAAVAGAYELMRSWLPGEGRAEIFEEVRKKMGPGARADNAFAEVVPVPDDAPLIDRLVAWTGRRP